MPREILPWTFIYELTSDGRYLCRLMGTAACARLGWDPTGHHIDEALKPEAYRSRKRIFDECLSGGLPIGYFGHLLMPGREHVRYLRLLMPLKKRVSADHIFGIATFPSIRMNSLEAGQREYEAGTQIVRFTPDDVTRIVQGVAP